MTERPPTDKTTTGFSIKNILTLVAVLLISKAVVFFGTVLILADGDPAALGYLLSTQGLSSLLHSIGTSWDSVDYQSIAQTGYGLVKNSELFAFSPVFPSLIYLLRFFTGSYVTASLLVPNVLSFVFPVIVLRLFGFRAALLTETFPVYVVFTMVAYSDVLALVFLGLGLLAFVRARYLVAGLSVAAAGLVFYDLLLVPLFLACWLGYDLAKKGALVGRAAKLLAALLLPAIVVGFSILAFYWSATDDPFTFFRLERGDWGVVPANPAGQLYWILHGSGTGSFSSIVWNIDGFLTTPAYWAGRNLVFEIFVFFGVYLLLRNRGPPLKWLFAGYSLVLSVPLLFFQGTPVYSIPRLLLPAFPVFFGYSKSLLSGRWRVASYLVVSLAAACWVLVSFIEGFFA